MLFYLISDFHADLLSDKLSILKLEEKIQTRNEIVSEKLQNFHQLKLSIEMKEKDHRFMTGETSLKVSNNIFQHHRLRFF